MHSFKECCHLGQQSAGEFSVGLRVSYIHIFHVFKFKSPTRMSALFKADVAAPRNGTQVEGNFWIVEDHHVRTSSGSGCRLVRE